MISWIVGGSRHGIAAFGFFLLFLGYRPALIGIKDILRRKSYPRTYLSAVSGGLLLSFGGILMLLAGAYAALACLAVMGALFNWIDAKAEKRSILREGFGALLAVPSAILVAPLAAPVLLIRPIASVLSVRGLIARWDDALNCRWISVALAASLIPLGLFAYSVGSWRMLAYSVCSARAVYAAMRAGKPVKASDIGIAEILVSGGVVLGWLGDILLTHQH